LIFEFVCLHTYQAERAHILTQNQKEDILVVFIDLYIVMVLTVNTEGSCLWDIWKNVVK